MSKICIKRMSKMHKIFEETQVLRMLHFKNERTLLPLRRFDNTGNKAVKGQCTRLIDLLIGWLVGWLVVLRILRRFSDISAILRLGSRR